MNCDMVEKIAQAVLYEGYLLYPYRTSALKNQQRWNFGVLYPPAWAAAQTGSDRSYFQMECLAICKEASGIEVSVRFLQLLSRSGRERVWQEAVERRTRVDCLSISDLAEMPRVEKFSFSGTEESNVDVIRRSCDIQTQIEISAVQVEEHTFRLTLRVSNLADCQSQSRDDALMHSLASAHAVLQIKDGKFVSQIDPPEELRETASACQNVGVWPVLVGERESSNTMLGSPIILYDYPSVAPESQGDLFDATEIDEILILRILTLTDQEKEELRRSDERARRILERLESSPPEHLLELHGTIRGLQQSRGDAWSAWDTVQLTPAGVARVSGTQLKRGDRVRLRPRKRADVFDTLLAGKAAIIEAVEEDFDGNIHFAVVLEDDPGRDLGEMRQAGHRFFFSVDEIEPIRTEDIE